MPTLYAPTIAQIPAGARNLTAFVRKLLTAAATQKRLPAPIALARDQMAARLDELLAVSDAQQAKPKGKRDARPAARDEDRAFSTLYLFLLAWSQSRGEHAAVARSVLAAIFPNKLDFIHFAFDKEWAHADGLLRRIDNVVAGQSIAGQIEALGGALLLDELRAVHQSYGEALGITVSRQEGEVEAAAPVSIVAPLRAAREAAQKYIVRVVAHAEESQPATVRLANVLLQAVPGAVGGPKPRKRKDTDHKSDQKNDHESDKQGEPAPEPQATDRAAS